MKCRHCQNQLEHLFIDLGNAPPSNSYVSQKELNLDHPVYPLKVMVCHHCWLVQTVDYVDSKEMFEPNYAYFSSVSKSWLIHASNYCEMITNRLRLDKNSYVVEVASNDGYLLKNFLDLGVPCLGIEPTKGTAAASIKLGIDVIQEFFSEKIANKVVDERKKADLIIANNVYAHVPMINDFTLGLKKLLNKNGTITVEFAYLMTLIKNKEFDTIYHEHFSYLSLHAVNSCFSQNGLKIYDVEELETHGGSLRVYGCHKNSDIKISKNVNNQLKKEKNAGLLDIATYKNFNNVAHDISRQLVKFLTKQKKDNKLVVGYGAAAKGNTLINYAGIKKDLLHFVCDAALSKQGKFLPGSHIPILEPDEIKKQKPDYVIILPWNLANEIKNELDFIGEWGGKFITAIPNLRIFESKFVHQFMIHNCQVCKEKLQTPQLNLGNHALCDELIPFASEEFCNKYPIEVSVCKSCLTANQLYNIKKEKLFPKEYHYRPRFTLDVINGMVELVSQADKVIGSLNNKIVCDIGCNDGTLLDYFQEKGAVTAGIEPTDSVLEAKKKKHNVIQSYFDKSSASQIVDEIGKPDIITFTNVFAHIENLDEALNALKILLKKNTIIIIENHYLGTVVKTNQFDTFYHEHPRTYSSKSFEVIAKKINKKLLGVHFPKRYGGNIRVYIGEEDVLIENGKKNELKKDINENFIIKDLISMQSNIDVWKESTREQIINLSKKYGKVFGKSFPARASILIELLKLDETIMPAIFEKEGSKKIGHYVPGSKIKLLGDDEWIKKHIDPEVIIIWGWHISKEIGSYMRSMKFKGRLFTPLPEFKEIKLDKF